jgi:hypothetical protein
LLKTEGKTALMTANQLSPLAIDPNAYTPEFKGFLVKMRSKGTRKRQHRAQGSVALQ